MDIKKGILITPGNSVVGMSVCKWKGDISSICGTIKNYDEALVEIYFPGVGTEYRSYDNIDIFETIMAPSIPTKAVPEPPTKYYVGQTFTCLLLGKRTEGKISNYAGNWYLCQNEELGNDCIDKLGYIYSWCIKSGSDADLEEEGVKNLKLNVILESKVKDRTVAVPAPPPKQTYRGYPTGSYFKATHKLAGIMTGKIFIDDNGRVTLCQNIIEGVVGDTLYGYKYGWGINGGSTSDLKNNNISDLEVSSFPFESSKSKPSFEGLGRDLRESDHCQAITLLIRDSEINGKLMYIGGNYYVLHNNVAFNGSQPPEGSSQYGYRHSWELGTGTFKELNTLGYHRITFKGLMKEKFTTGSISGVSFTNGDYFSAVYDGQHLLEGKVRVNPDSGECFLCQDYVYGYKSQVDFGYKYAMADFTKIKSIKKVMNAQLPTNRELKLYDFVTTKYYKCKIKGVEVSGIFTNTGTIIIFYQDKVVGNSAGYDGYKYGYKVKRITNQGRLEKEGITDLVTSKSEFISLEEKSHSYKVATFDKVYENEDDYEGKDFDLDLYEEDEYSSSSLLSEEELCEVLLFDDDKEKAPDCKKALTKQEISVASSTPVTKRNTSDLVGCHGVSYTAIYYGESIEGKISVHAGDVYLCNNNYVGRVSPTPLMFRYEYGLGVLQGTDDDLAQIGVRDLKVNIKIASHVKDPRLDLQIKTKAKKRLDLSVKTDHKQIF